MNNYKSDSSNVLCKLQLNLWFLGLIFMYQVWFWIYDSELPLLGKTIPTNLSIPMASTNVSRSVHSIQITKVKRNSRNRRTSTPHK